MIVKLRFSIDQLFIIAKLLKKVHSLNFAALSVEEKINASIGAELYILFEKKKLSIQQKLDLLNRDKKISLSLKYYEVWALKKLFVNYIALLDNQYQSLNAQNVINLLDKKVNNGNDEL